MNKKFWIGAVVSPNDKFPFKDYPFIKRGTPYIVTEAEDYYIRVDSHKNARFIYSNDWFDIYSPAVEDTFW